MCFSKGRIRSVQVPEKSTKVRSVTTTLHPTSASQTAICIISHHHLPPHSALLPLIPPLHPPFFSAHSCGLSPQAVMQSSDSCAQSQGLELARQTGKGRRRPAQPSAALAKEKQQEGRKEERGEVKVGGCSGRRASRASEAGKQRGLSEMAAVEGGKERRRRKRREKKHTAKGKKKKKSGRCFMAGAAELWGKHVFFIGGA